MSTYTSEPGTRLAGRYRLVDQVAAGNGWTLWKAIDETLARPVSILTFVSGFPRIAQVVTAARAASRLTDPRMAQVFDVEDGGGQAYIVLEWVGGESLSGLLDEGPLDPSLACSLIGDAARAVAGAHALGQAHLRLTPDTLWWTRGSGIKITGLGIDAALAGDGLTGAAAYDPSVADTVAIAALLYAALTGYWPGEEPTRLPAAPLSDGMVCTPRQVSADVSSALDSLIIRALLQRPTRQGPPIQSPADFAEALSMVAPPVPLPEPAPPAPGRLPRLRQYQPDPNNPDSWATPRTKRHRSLPAAAVGSVPGRGGYGGNQYTGAQYAAADYQGGQRSAARRPEPGAAGRGHCAGARGGAVLVWVVGFRKLGRLHRGRRRHVTRRPRRPRRPGGTVLKPVSDSTFNIFGSPARTTPRPDDANGAIDGSPSTSWSTSVLLRPRRTSADLKPGTGLLIDMGKEVRLSQVEVLFGTSAPRPPRSTSATRPRCRSPR